VKGLLHIIEEPLRGFSINESTVFCSQRGWGYYKKGAKCDNFGTLINKIISQCLLQECSCIVSTIVVMFTYIRIPIHIASSILSS
jgi:hypothetical protein